MESALPYRIPGPAGGVCTQQHAPNAQEKPLLNLFRTAPWREMLAHVNRKIPSSLALLRRNALSNDFLKLATLPVLIDSLVYVGKDASVVLRDPTGYVRGTIHADVFVERKDMLDRGVVLLLNGVSALAYLEESRGFRGGEDVVHLSVQACHVSNVFKGGNAVPQAPPQAPASRSFLDDYEPQARRPKPVVKPPVARTPLRERNYQRPTSRGFQPTSRGGGGAGAGSGRGRRGPPHPNHQLRPNSNHRMKQQYPRHPYHQYQRQHNQSNPPHNAHNPDAPNQRPMVGSNQHKRPFRSPAMKSATTERAMPPPQKRPNVRQYHQPNIPPRHQAPVAGAITDDQLESLLGDLDVDAIIAAHGKSQSPPSRGVSSAPRGPPSRQAKTTCETAGLPERDHGRPRGSPSTQRTNTNDAIEADGRPLLVKSNKEYSSAQGDNPAVPQMPSSEVATNDIARREEVIDLVSKVVEPDAPKPTDQRIILNVDQDMVNDLFDGVDASDFM